jgi:hypothetical protein
MPGRRDPAGAASLHRTAETRRRRIPRGSTSGRKDRAQGSQRPWSVVRRDKQRSGGAKDPENVRGSEASRMNAPEESVSLRGVPPGAGRRSNLVLTVGLHRAGWSPSFRGRPQRPPLHSGACVSDVGAGLAPARLTETRFSPREYNATRCFQHGFRAPLVATRPCWRATWFSRSSWRWLQLLA